MDIEQLLKPRLPEADVELAGVGTVRVRGLSRAEALAVRDIEGTEAIERFILARGMVDPPMTEDEIGHWQQSSPAGEMEPVTDKVAELSGMLPDSAKVAVKEFTANPDSEFSVLPSGEAEHDGVGATDPDV